MHFQKTSLSGAFTIEMDRIEDERGFFARTFCADEFRKHGLATSFVQANMSLSHDPGTLRGLHFQRGPAQETKLVRCIAGRLFDVIVDNRPDSPTFLKHVSVELSAESGRALYVPKGFAHGFQTLEPGTVASYMVDEFYAQGHEGGYHYNDPVLDIAWPLDVTTISQKDKSWPMISDRG